MQKALKAEDVRNICHPGIFENIPGATDAETKVIIGQERAIKALELGLGIKAHGFNIYVSGNAGTGKLTAVTSFVSRQAMKESVPCDWCYVNNFKDTYRPQKLSLPAGKAITFKKEVKALVREIFHSLVKVFESEDYANRKQKIIGQFETEQANILGKVTEHAEKASFMVKQTPTSIITIPLKNEQPITQKQLKEMGEKELDEITKKQDELQEELGIALREIQKQEKETNRKLDQLEKEIAESAIGNLIGELTETYKNLPQVTTYLAALKSDIMDNLPEFMKSQKSKTDNAANGIFLKRYEITVLVDNTQTSGAPVIAERNPTYNNLLGRVEKQSYMGTLFTDFTMIQQGALHTANGGYLIIRIEELLQNPFSWDCLKRALKNKEIILEDIADQLGYLTARTLKPEPIPLDIKVILIGNPLYYQLLYEYDSDFRQLFKIKADFDSEMPRTDKNIAEYAGFVTSLCKKEKLLPPENTALAKIIEYSSRLARHQDKLNASFGKISDIVMEANYYAGEELAGSIKDVHVEKAIEHKAIRSNLIQEKINEMITTKQIFIDTAENVIGQINGLSVIDIGDISFGIPSRITCSISLGKEGVIAVEREAELSGPIHTKGVLILTGYLAAKFMQDKPVSLAARLVFEQSYSEIEGDSASCAELYAILSSLSTLPIKQGIAVTGSVNQKGEVQPIGGINEKIEGYFEICRQLGLDGQQGVIVPAANVKNLMLKEEVVEAVKQGKFKIWAVDSIEDGIEILTGVKAGSIWEEGTVFYYVNSSLAVYSERMKQFSSPDVIETVID